MKFLANTLWFISFFVSSLLCISLVACIAHCIWNGETEKVTFHLIRELSLFFVVSAALTYMFNNLRNNLTYETKEKKSDYRYSKRDAPQPNFPFNN